MESRSVFRNVMLLAVFLGVRTLQVLAIFVVALTETYCIKTKLANRKKKNQSELRIIN